MRLTESMEKKKRNIEDTPLFNSYIVLTIIVAVALMGGGILCSPTVPPTAKVLLLFELLLRKLEVK